MIEGLRAVLAFGVAALGLLACTDNDVQANENTGAKTRGETSRGTTHDVSARSHEPMRFVDKGDLARIRERGALRIAVLPAVPEPVTVESRPASADRRLAERFARSLGLKVELLPARTRDDLFDMVEKGEADLAAGNLTITEARRRRFAWSRPTRVVREVLVGRRGAPDLPRAPEQLAGHEVFVWGRSSYAETIRDLARSRAPGVKVHATRPDLDDETLLYLVAAGQIPLTVVDADILHSVQKADPDLLELCTLHEGRNIGWAVRKDNPHLLAAANSYVVERAIDAGRSLRSTGDLAEMRERGVLRVLMHNNSVSYFLYKGAPRGFDFELAEMLAEDLDLRVEVLVPQEGEDLITWLREGRGDIIAASMTVTPERQRQVAFSVPYLYVDEVLVARAGSEPIRSLEQLRQHPIHLRRSSSYFSTVERLAKTHGAFQVVPAPENLETEDLIAMVGKGDIDFTIADDHVLGIELAWRSDIEPSLRLTKAAPGLVDSIGKPRDRTKSIAFACRQDNPRLLAAVDAWVKKVYRGTAYNLARRRYFDRRYRKQGMHNKALVAGRISDYDEMFKKYARLYGLDWRLIAAQCWQESRFDPAAKSWVGAQGLMQVMPATGKEMGYTDLEDPDTGIHAGVQYLAKMVDRFDDGIPLEERIYFALASYNGGRGHVLDAMRLARTRGLDPQRWFDNVEKCILMLENKAIAKKARYGYCRGSEVHHYVQAIRDRYVDYARIIPR